MLTVRVLQNTKHLTKYVCVSNVIKREESNDPTKPPMVPNEPKKSNPKPRGAKVKSETQKKEAKPRKKDVIDPVLTDSNRQSFKSWENKLNKKYKEPEPMKLKSDFFQNLMDTSAENVAKEFKGDVEKTKSDLLGYLKTFEVSREAPKESPKEKYVLASHPSPRSIFKKVEPLRIFRKNKTEMDSLSEQIKLNIWNDLEKEELVYNSQISPANYFEEQIQWTKEGRLWHFPIDNDQGLEKEAEISFTEHIFMEKHLEPWCPKRGPLRKFMEMVLIGLAKNPYLSVEDKKEHIAWFKDYFENKKKLLKELGAFDTVKEIESPKQEAKSQET